MDFFLESLDQMTTWAVEKFKDVRNKSIDPPAFEGHALTSNELMVSRGGRNAGGGCVTLTLVVPVAVPVAVPVTRITDTIADTIANTITDTTTLENHLCQARQGRPLSGYDIPISGPASLVSSAGM
jgi:hypothetical protein